MDVFNEQPLPEVLGALPMQSGFRDTEDQGTLAELKQQPAMVMKTPGFVNTLGFS